MSVVFLFGAGASYGSGDCLPYCPPLGKALFPDLLCKGGIVATLDNELRQLFEDDFESGMAKFIDTHNVEMPTLLREMSEYFAPFTPGPTNVYRRLVDYLGRWQNEIGEQTKQRVVLATTNYDLLLEQAILNTGGAVVYPNNAPDPDLAYSRMPNGLLLSPVDRNSRWAKYDVKFTARYRAFELLKMHGSCNFLPKISPESMQNVRFQNVVEAVAGPVTPVLPGEAVLDYLSQTDSLAPAISMYTEGKQVLFSADYVREHQARFQAAVEEADKIFLVGIRIWPPDTHIWDYIATSKSWLGYVGREPDEFRAWCEENARSNQHVLACSFEDALPVIEQEIADVTR